MHTVYKRLIAHIAATDRLIDEVAYRLYGLTEEEIAVVEGEGENLLDFGPSNRARVRIATLEVLWRRKRLDQFS